MPHPLCPPDDEAPYLVVGQVPGLWGWSVTAGDGWSLTTLRHNGLSGVGEINWDYVLHGTFKF